MNRLPFSVSRREPARHDNKLILGCPACHHRCLVDVKPKGKTHWICPACMQEVVVKSDVKSREEWDSQLRRGK